MKARLANLDWKMVWPFAAIVAAGILFLPRQDHRGPEIVAETRQSLRQQGFKTDLADFNFSTPPEMRDREALLKATAPTNRLSEPFVNHPNLMEAVGTNSAIVVWKLVSLKNQNPSWPDNREQLTWEEFREALDENQAVVDAAATAILSGPIRFNLDASHGGAMLLPHLALMKNLTQTLGSRTMLALHDGNQGVAWTNLLAETRLVTAWEPEPAEVSHLVRFAGTALAFNALWQALQTNGWPDGQLAQLQVEWEAVNFFTNLPEMEAFKGASQVAMCQWERREPLSEGHSFAEFSRYFWSSPLGAWSMLKHNHEQQRYRRLGTYEDEKALLLFYRDRELELRKAVQAPTWSAMRAFPGVAKPVLFQSKYRYSRLQIMSQSREIGMMFQREGAGLLGRAARAEAQRRLIITALALERYRGKYGAYPKTLSELAPEFLKVPPIDFMDGQPLRYRLATDGHFLLYSVGLDCVDDGGQMPSRERQRPLDFHPGEIGKPPKGDIVWPLPASAAAVESKRKQETRAVELRNRRALEAESEEDWKRSPLRQARVKKILATKWSPNAGSMSYQGRPVNEDIRNPNVAGTNRPSLAELLTPKQIITGAEPEDLTFELPVSYDVITNRGELTLVADANPESVEEPDSGAKLQECNRAANGDCLLVWHTIYDPPGEHAIQAQLFWESDKRGYFETKGPAIPIVTSNLCQFSLDSSSYDIDLGATFHARLPETNGLYVIECVSTNGEHLKSLAGSTTNGEFNVVWNLVGDHGRRLTGETFNSIVRITLPESGRTQILRGP